MSRYLPILGAKKRMRLDNIPITELRFMEDNPRVYEETRGSQTQDALMAILERKEYVKKLVDDIRRQGGVQMPLTVVDQDGDKTVVDGNGRLAALRRLASDDPDSWRTVTCEVIEEEITPDELLALLSQRHLTGQRKWVSYEQANLLYRNHYERKMTHDDLKRNTGLSTQKIRTLIGTIQAMKDNGDKDQSHWSAYEVLLTTKAIVKGCNEKPGLKQRLREIIKNEDDDTTAQDIRKKIPQILVGAPRNLKQFISGKRTLAEAYRVAEGAGELTKRVREFRAWLEEAGRESEVGKHSQNEQNAFEQQLKKTNQLIHRILQHMRDKWST